MTTWNEIERGISAATERPFRIADRSRASGGCINAAWIVGDETARYFVKINSGSQAAMFEAEALALAELRQAAEIRVPAAICVGADAESSWIVLEHLALSARSLSSDARLGAQLAALHRHTASEHGWHRDNTIGSTPQKNVRCADWHVFWKSNRLSVQLELAARNGYGRKLQSRGERLLDALPRFFTHHRPKPSLLHGDLWSGNAAADADGNPVVFDPALYYGDRETDLAMTELFGGYSAPFYAAYAESYPLDEGYAVRKTLYNLYHVLNHLNLFGTAYLRQSQGMIESLIAEVSS